MWKLVVICFSLKMRDLILLLSKWETWFSYSPYAGSTIQERWTFVYWKCHTSKYLCFTKHSNILSSQNKFVSNHYSCTTLLLSWMLFEGIRSTTGYTRIIFSYFPVLFRTILFFLLNNLAPVSFHNSIAYAKCSY